MKKKIVPLIKKELKAAYFVGGDHDGELEGLSQHPQYIDKDIEPSMIVLPGSAVPALTKERYFLYPEEILIHGDPVAIYIIQGWGDREIVQYLLSIIIQVLVAPDDLKVN